MKRAEITCQDGEAEVYLYDLIGDYWGEGISAQQFADDLAALTDATRITIRINSPGGAVFDGITMYNALRRLKIPSVAAVDGVAASAAALVAMGAQRVTMAETARLMIHEAMGTTQGRASDHRDMAAVLDGINETQIGVFADKSATSRAKVAEWLAAETWFSAEQAHAAGFSDATTEPLRVAACIPPGLFAATPPELVMSGPAVLGEPQETGEDWRAKAAMRRRDLTLVGP